VLRTLLAVFLVSAAPCVALGQQPEQLPGLVVDVRADDFQFTAPPTIPAGLTTFRLTQGGTAGHQLWISRLPEGRTFEEFAAANVEGKPTPWATHLGGPGFTDPPKTTNATLVLTPGTYALVCRMGADGDPRAHLKKGMLRRLDVTAAGAGTLVEPTTDVTVTILDDGFEFSPSLTAGRHTLRVLNSTSGNRQFRLQRVLPGRTVEEAMNFQRGTGPSGRTISGAGAVPFDTRGRLSIILPKQYLITTVDLPPGTYLIASLPARDTAKVIEVR
jgi:hypothetical protein